MSIQKLREKQDRIMNSINKEQQRFERMVKENKETEKAFIQAKKELKDVEEKVVLFNNKLDASCKEVTEVSAIISTKDSTIKEFDKQIKELGDDWQKQVSIDKKRRDELDENFDKLKQDQERQIKGLRNEANDLEEIRAALLSGNETISDGTVKLNEKNEEAKLVLEKLEKKFEIVGNNLKLLLNKVEATKRETIGLETKKSVKVKKIADIEKDIEQAEKKAKIAETKAKTEQNKLDKIIAKRVGVSKKEQNVENAILQIRDIYKEIGEESPI